MKKALWIVGAIVVIIGFCLGLLYHDAMGYKRSQATIAKNEVLKHYDVKKVKNVSAFHGDVPYQVVDAVQNSGEEVYIMIPDKKSKAKAQVIPANTGYTKKEILAAFKSHVSYRSIVSTQLGMVSGNPAWEIVYKDNENRFVFSYYNFNNGDSLSDPIAIQ
ncbi:uncharacterized protein YpmB [Pullulanibacillus pueri]|uniref:Cell wall elongation regulator TseB-like domain-containing protein n=1 Tax=Pullulanibacillus pueri TaxID=1437324 RepID=A0A8J3EKY4_9BACL|nr:DUF5590 domain-containing protein [Pullulanibacillus pueri]MBM7681435.1 uncharacterized protein YpmB [Pullulanibacillus pueri]GGH78866.1 hypothetical protein GCM10007096_12940 [Pullulanibacillus pueri]